MDSQKIFTVTELNTYVKGMFDNDDILSSIFVKGEISNYKLHSSGNHYLTIKDEGGVVNAVMFRGYASKLRFNLENGMKIIAHGRAAVFVKSGQYQLYLDDITPDGIGALYVAYEQLKEKLYKEGLFDRTHKKPLPRFPSRIAIVTSPTGAAIRDMLRILGHRYPMAKVRLYPVRVQGDEAPAEICEGIAFINKYNLADLIITGRGGGSIEDLWAFNNECVARTIYESNIPVISAVGHEPDETISDYVADLRAATPSNAAELAVPNSAELYDAIISLDMRMKQSMRRNIALRKERLDIISNKRVLKNPIFYVQDKRMLFEHTLSRFDAAANSIIGEYRKRFIRLETMIDALDPEKVLKRGYSIVSDENGNIVKKSDSLSIGDVVKLKFGSGEALCRVENTFTEASNNGK